MGDRLMYAAALEVKFLADADPRKRVKESKSIHNPENDGDDYDAVQN